jgi:hypothetical protein
MSRHLSNLSNLKEKLLDKDSHFAKTNPKLFDGLSKFVHLVEEEQGKVQTGFEELKEQAKMASVKSMIQLRRTQAHALNRFVFYPIYLYI